MAQVTYRGVRYETGTKDKKDPQAKTLTYRGHAYSVGAVSYTHLTLPTKA